MADGVKDWNSDEWMDGLDILSPEWNRRMSDARRLQEWLYPHVESNGSLVAVSVAAAALSWTEHRVLEAVQAHYWAFVVDGAFIDLDGE